MSDMTAEVLLDISLSKKNTRLWFVVLCCQTHSNCLRLNGNSPIELEISGTNQSQRHGTRMTALSQPGSIERTIALSEIQTVLNTYCTLARENADWDQMAALFTADAKFRFGLGGRIVVQPSQMSAVVGGGEAAYIRHHLTSWRATFMSDTEARVDSQFLAITDQTPLGALDHWGRWEDVFVKEGPTWVIRDRLVVGEGAHPNGWLAERSKSFEDGK